MKNQKGISTLLGTIILTVILAIVSGILIYSSSLVVEKTNPPNLNLRNSK